VRRLFGTAGIRGRYLEEVTTELAYAVGASVSTYFKGGKVVVGGDGRLTTPLLKMVAAAGAMAAGSDVYDAGLVPMPALPWSVREYSASAGIYVTASHNPPTDNGMKVFSSRAMELTSSEEVAVEEMVRGRSWRVTDWDGVGRYSSLLNVVRDYSDALRSRLEPERVRRVPKVLVDTANGAASLVTPKVLRDVGAVVQSINSNIDGRFPGRHPEPRPDVLLPYLPVARSLGVDVFLAHDGDGDRLAVVDPKEGFIKQDRLIALIAKYKLRDRGGAVVVSIDCGNSVKDVVNSMGGELVVVRLGKTHEGLLKRPNAVVAAEPWKLIDPEWGPWVDGIYQAVLLVKLMAEEGQGIGDLMKQVPNYPQARYSLRVPKGVRDELYEHLAQQLLSSAPETAEVLTIDGVRVDYEDRSWILIRKSGTEPKVRFYGEARSVGELEGLINRYVAEARRYLKSRGVTEVEVEGALVP